MTRFTDSPYEPMMTRRPEGGKAASRPPSLSPGHPCYGCGTYRPGQPLSLIHISMMGKEWGGMGQNYLRSLLALGFQAFLIIVCVAIYAVLVQNIATEEDIIMAIWSCVGYTVLLCFTLFKTCLLYTSRCV